MSQRPATRWLAFVLSLLTFAALILALPVTPLVGSRQATAQASVATGDLIFKKGLSGGGNAIAKRAASGGTVTDLKTMSPYTANVDPDVSPDGSSGDSHQALDPARMMADPPFD